MSYSDPDIQEAPVYPVLFQIEQSDHTILSINPKKEFIVRCSVYVPTELMQQIKQQSHFIYATILDKDIPIIQKVGQITLPSSVKNNILQFAISFKLSEEFDGNQINLQIAVTPKHEGEMGIGESIRIGRFINTHIPLEK